MKIVIPGGSGQVGQVLARALVAAGHDVVILSRKSAGQGRGGRAQDKSAGQERRENAQGKSAGVIRCVEWDARTLGPWTHEIDEADVVINLAGRNVNCRYNAANCADIMNSRIDSTRVIGQAIAAAKRPPKAWLQASTATIYAHRFDAPNDEATGILGGTEGEAPSTWRFSIEVAKAWEQAANDAAVPHTRKVLMRSAMTMSADRGGIFDVLLGLTRKGLGGQSGDGRQYISWIHERDFVQAVRWLIEHDIEGPVNISSPNPLPNAEFMRALRLAAGVPIGLPASRWMLEIGAVFMRTETELLLKSRRVVPGRLLDAGFTFEFPHWAEAAKDLVGSGSKTYVGPGL